MGFAASFVDDAFAPEIPGFWSPPQVCLEMCFSGPPSTEAEFLAEYEGSAPIWSTVSMPKSTKNGLFYPATHAGDVCRRTLWCG